MKSAQWMFAVLCVTALAHGPVRAEDIRFIDTHAHLEHLGNLSNFPAAAERALADMERKGISFTILMPPPQAPRNKLHYDYESLQTFVQQHPDKFGLMGGGGSLNLMIEDTAADGVSDRDKQRFRAKAEEIVAAGALGFGEIAIVHFSLPQMGDQHPYEEVPADHPLLLLLADIAAEKDVPVDIHFDVSPEDRPLPGFLPTSRNPGTLHENLAAFERLLAHNPKAKIVWAHAGTDPGQMRTPDLCRRLLTTYPNLYMSLRTGRGQPAPAGVMTRDGEVKQPWLKLIQDFPDRFTLGSDQFHPPFENGRRTFAEGLDTLRALVSALPPDLARKVAYENARRIYKLP
jgi:predicted TIM-barrel fold metal-dependent hydrolase